MTQERTPEGNEFHARGPATQKALSLRRRLVRVRLKSSRELERKQVSEQRLDTSCNISILLTFLAYLALV